jgi:DNA polymerase-3 subunit gamma/tau
VALFERKREIKLASLLKRGVRLVHFEDGRIEFNPDKSASADLAGQVGKMLTQWTGRRWVVSVANAAGEPSLYDQDLERAKADPLIRSILDAFPGAAIDKITRADDTTH